MISASPSPFHTSGFLYYRRSNDIRGLAGNMWWPNTIDGTRRYVITFTDLYSRFSFAWATTSHASYAAKEFFLIVKQVFPYPLQYVLTDNGSEFMKHFDEEL